MMVKRVAVVAFPGLLLVLAAWAIPGLVITSGPASTGQVGQLYSSAIVANGGFPPYHFTITSGTLPPGLNLDSNTGAITGTPAQAGAFTFTVTVDDAGIPTANSPAQSARPRSARQASAPALTAMSPFTITIAGGGAAGAPVLSTGMLIGLAAGIALLGGLFLKAQTA